MQVGGLPKSGAVPVGVRRRRPTPPPARRLRTMQILLRGLDGRTSALEVRRRTSVRRLKRLIEERTGVAPSKQRLTARGAPLLRETATLESCGVGEATLVELGGRLRGGCQPHALKLYMRCLHLFKVFVSLYMFMSGCVMISDYSIHQAFGTQYIFWGILVLCLAVTKPCNILMGHYGSVYHNKFALLVVIVFDGAVIFVQSSLAIIFIVDGSPKYERELRRDCSKSVHPRDSQFSTQDCTEYWDDDRTAGFRLAWMSTYYMGIREKDQARMQQLEEYQAKGMCCGFGPPANCDFVENKELFPTPIAQEDLFGGDMLRQRVSCSDVYDAWYPAELGTCGHYDEADYKESFILGCKYDWAAGLCVDRDVEDGSRGCAAFFEDRMNEKLYPQGIILFGSILLEGFTVFAACFYCWKRKEDDVLPVTYIYEEPWDPIKEGKLKLHEPQDAAQHGEED